MNLNIFKAYDIRGLYPSEVNPAVMFEIALGLVKYFSLKSKKKTPKIVIGRDARIGSPTLYKAVIKGLQRAGIKTQIVKIGLATTPMFYFLVAKLKAQGGIMVTASHNPKNWNGLKVVGKNAEMIGGKKVLKIINRE